jgi:hypothetical protein
MLCSQVRLRSEGDYFVWFTGSAPLPPLQSLLTSLAFRASSTAFVMFGGEGGVLIC